MKKLKLMILKITPEPNPKGVTLLRIKAESGGKIYEFGATEEDYLDDQKRASIHATFLKQVKRDQKAILQSPKDKEAHKAKLKAMVGTEVEEDE